MKNKLHYLNARVTEEVRDKVKNYCENNGLKVQWFIEQAAMEYMDKREKEVK